MEQRMYLGGAVIILRYTFHTSEVLCMDKEDSTSPPISLTVEIISFT